MKIKKITLKNYKFHHDLSFNIASNNCLIYGENGTGKSSIYKALYSNFYYFKDDKIVNKKIKPNLKEKFIHRDFSHENLEVNIEFNNNCLNRENNNLNNKEIIKNQTIYFADEKIFHKIIQDDFYQVINTELIKHFPQLKELDSIYRTIRTKVIRRTTTIDEKKDLLEDREKIDKVFKNKFKEKIPLTEINMILQSLDENFEIDFEIKNSDIRFDESDNDKKIIAPKIAIKVKNIDDKGDFKNHFNEAKLKLISIAIYFALAQKYETNSSLKLLVLDDFLTSLDMSNRKLIMWYILENFGDYQKIILTHNLQFYTMIVRLLISRGENENWDIKNIFLDSGEVAIVSDRNENYLLKAEEELNSYHLEVSGNFLRKEFERIVNEFEQLLELGRVEELDNVIKALKNLDNLFPEPSKNLKNISNKFNNILANPSTDDSAKYQQLKDEIETIPDELRFRNNELTFLKETILKTEFYKNILMNYSSHDDRAKELYRKEFTNSIKLLKELNKILKNLKA